MEKVGSENVLETEKSPRQQMTIGFNVDDGKIYQVNGGSTILDRDVPNGDGPLAVDLSRYLSSSTLLRCCISDGIHRLHHRQRYRWFLRCSFPPEVLT